MTKNNVGKKLITLTKTNVKKFLGHICYSYAGYKVFDFSKRLNGYKKERNSIYQKIGYYPDLKNPKSFNEKVLWKKIYDRNPLLPVISDKYKVREYIKGVIGEKEAEKLLVPLLYVTDKPENIPFDTFPEEYVIKPNHASGKIIFVEKIEKQKKYTIIERQKTTILSDCKASREQIINVCNKWLSTPYGFCNHEWAYQKIKRKIIIEKLLLDNSQKIPVDFKFEVFHGKCHFIQVWYDRFVRINRAWYTPDWKYINIQGSTSQSKYKKKPDKLESMIKLAELLGKPFDFVRVDLYLVDNRIYFGELTSYPKSGRISFNPASFDFELGSKWKVVPKYWK